MSNRVGLYIKVSENIGAASRNIPVVLSEVADRKNAFFQTTGRIKELLAKTDDPFELNGLKRSLWEAYRYPHEANLASILELSRENPAAMVRSLGVISEDDDPALREAHEKALDAITAATRLHFATLNSIQLQARAIHLVYASVSSKILAKMKDYGPFN